MPRSHNFHAFGWLLLVLAVLLALFGFSIAADRYSGALGATVIAGAVSVAFLSIIPFGFGTVVDRLDAILQHNKHLDRLDPDLRQKLDEETAKRKELQEKIRQSQEPQPNEKPAP